MVMAQFGWLIDLDRCIGCDTCSVACKSENNTRPIASPLMFKNLGGAPVLGNPVGVIADHVSYRWVVKRETGTYPAARANFVTSSCNHCVQPACMAACPMSNPNDPSNENNAIFKRASDGVVLINDFEGDEPRQGEIRRLRITESHDYDLVGTLLPSTGTVPQFAPAPLIQIAV